MTTGLSHAPTIDEIREGTYLWVVASLPSSAAAVIALIGAVLVLLYARGADARAVAAASPTTVYVSSAADPGGHVDEGGRPPQAAHRDPGRRAASLPAGALTTVDDSNSALVALTDIPPGQYVLAAAFGETPIGREGAPGRRRQARRVACSSRTRPGSAPS